MQYRDHVDLLRLLVHYLAIHPRPRRPLSKIASDLALEEGVLRAVLDAFPALFRAVRDAKEVSYALQARLLEDGRIEGRNRPQSEPEIDQIHRFIERQSELERLDRSARRLWSIVAAAIAGAALVVAAVLWISTLTLDRNPPIEGNQAAQIKEPNGSKAVSVEPSSQPSVESPKGTIESPSPEEGPPWGWIGLGVVLAALAAAGLAWIWSFLRKPERKPTGWAAATAVAGPIFTGAGGVLTVVAPLFTVQVDQRVHNLLALIFTAALAVSIMLLILGWMLRGKRLAYLVLGMLAVTPIVSPWLAPSWRAELIKFWAAGDGVQVAYVIVVSNLTVLGLLASCAASYWLASQKKADLATIGAPSPAPPHRVAV